MARHGNVKSLHRRRKETRSDDGFAWYREFGRRIRSRRAWKPRGRRADRLCNARGTCIIASFAAQTLATAGQEPLTIDAWEGFRTSGLYASQTAASLVTCSLGLSGTNLTLLLLPLPSSYCLFECAMRRNDRLVGSYSRQSVEIEFLAQLHECHPRKSFFLPDQRAGNSVGRLKPSIAGQNQGRIFTFHICPAAPIESEVRRIEDT